MQYHAQALVPTDDPDRYAAGLAKQLGDEFETEWSADAGYVRLPDGLCDMLAWPEGLRLDAFADSDEHLRHVEEIVQRSLTRASGAPPLTFEWTRRPAIATTPTNGFAHLLARLEDDDEHD
ncbi:MAG: DUF2218 domain-containing protein [Candidatus Eremiobacteraeota bacterium]|nr:DUF2218 domain-containing protein [Candidatus Eremiobacteraeota bacterium]